MIMYFDLLVDLIVFSDELFDSVLLDHVEHITFSVEVLWLDVHFFYYDMKGFKYYFDLMIWLDSIN